MRNLKSYEVMGSAFHFDPCNITSVTSRDVLVCNVKAVGGWTDGFIFRSVARAEKTKSADESKANCCSGNKTSPSLTRWEALYSSVRS